VTDITLKCILVTSKKRHSSLGHSQPKFPAYSTQGSATAKHPLASRTSPKSHSRRSAKVVRAKTAIDSYDSTAATEEAEVALKIL
jgi:hypothetical protein